MLKIFPLAKSIADWPAGPPRHIQGHHPAPEDWADEVVWAEPSRCIHQPTPAGDLTPAARKSFGPKDIWVPPAYLVRLKAATVAGMPVAVINRHGMILGDISIDWRFPRINHKFLYPAVRWEHRLRRPALLLAATGAETYFHWMFESVSRGWLLKEARLLFHSFSHIIVNTTRIPYQLAMLQHLGIPSDRLVALDRCKTLRCDDLWVPSFPSSMGHYRPEALAWLKLAFAPKRPISDRRKIIISRRFADCRRIKNEKQLQPLLKAARFDWVVLEKMKISEQIAHFAACSHVIAPHGAGLSNLAFAPVTCRVLEYFHPHQVNVCYWSLACAKRQLYRAGLAQPSAEGDIKELTKDILIPPDQLKADLTSWL